MSDFLARYQGALDPIGDLIREVGGIRLANEQEREDDARAILEAIGVPQVDRLARETFDVRVPEDNALSDLEGLFGSIGQRFSEGGRALAQRGLIGGVESAGSTVADSFSGVGDLVSRALYGQAVAEPPRPAARESARAQLSPDAPQDITGGVQTTAPGSIDLQQILAMADAKGETPMFSVGSDVSPDELVGSGGSFSKSGKGFSVPKDPRVIMAELEAQAGERKNRSETLKSVLDALPATVLAQLANGNEEEQVKARRTLNSILQLIFANMER